MHLLATLVLILASTANCRRFGVGTPSITKRYHATTVVQPAVVAASHNLVGYEAEHAADGNDNTFWLVPGGQRMEMMSCAAAPLSSHPAFTRDTYSWHVRFAGETNGWCWTWALSAL